MQFRERAKVIQLIRTIYDPAIKRGRAELVGRLDKDTPVIDAELRAACSPAELAEIEAYLADRARALTRDAMGRSAQDLAAHMRMAESYFRAGGDAMAGSLAAEIFTAWDDLKKAMHKAGFRKDKN